MTFYQATLTARGYNEKRRKEIENMSLSIRPIYGLLYNMFAEKGKQKTLEQLWPLGFDKEEAKAEKKVFIPASSWINILKSQLPQGDGKQ